MSTFRCNLSDEDIYLPGELAELASYMSASGVLPQAAYVEIMEAADILHHLGITGSEELGKALGAKLDGKKWVYKLDPALVTLGITPAPDLSDEEYADLVYEGRKLCEAEELDCAYMGTVDRTYHDSQVQDPTSWVHSSRCAWLDRGLEGYRASLPLQQAKTPPKFSDRRKAVNATKRKTNDE